MLKFSIDFEIKIKVLQNDFNRDLLVSCTGIATKQDANRIQDHYHSAVSNNSFVIAKNSLSSHNFNYITKTTQENVLNLACSRKWHQKANLKRSRGLLCKSTPKQCSGENFPSENSCHFLTELRGWPERWARLKVIVMQKMSVFISSQSTRKAKNRT